MTTCLEIQSAGRQFEERPDAEFENPTVGDMLSALESLHERGSTTLYASLRDEEGWCVEAYENGTVVFHNGDLKRQILLKHAKTEVVMNLWQLLQNGNRDEIKRRMKGR
jgi:hypothetical protein